MKNKCFIVLDLGSSSFRASAFSQDLKIIKQNQKPIMPKFDGDKAEYDGKQVLETGVAVLDNLINSLPKDIEPISIGLTSQRSSFVMWDKESGEILAPVLSWQDGRANEQINSAKISQEQVHKITGLYKTKFYSAPKILWCLENVEAVKKSAEKGTLLIAPLASFFIWHLSGKKVFSCDSTLAQRTLLFDINNLQYSDELLEIFKIKKTFLPTIKSSADDYGTYRNIKISLCVGDQQSALAGAGNIKKNDTLINTGTGAFVMQNIGNKPASIQGFLTSVSFDKNYFFEAPITSAGTLYKWLQKEGIKFYEKDIDSLCRKSKDPILFFPALGGLGAPYWNFELSPFFKNLGDESKTEDIICGVSQSIAFMMKNILGFLKKGDIKVSGGLTQINYIFEFLTSILGVENISKSKDKELTSLGACLIMSDHLKIKTNYNEQDHFEQIPPLDISSEKAQKLANDWQEFFNYYLEHPYG